MSYREANQAWSMSMDSKDTKGAAASKKLRVALWGKRLAMEPVKAAEASGPAAMMTFPSGISVTSPGTTVISGWLR